MENRKLDRIINIIREEMMTTGSTPGKPGFSSAAPAKGPTAGFDPVMGKMMKRKKKKYISMGKGSRKRWMNQDGK
tara:strand:- start:85 stop:309 length:225 start_codon:yes stop_codon:yes gene_type:complete